MKNIIKKILAIWMSIYLIVVPPFAHAASAGGWSFSSFDLAKNLVTAMKNGASASVAVAKSPISQKIAKGIVGGAIAGAAIPLAISQLTGIALEAVDWVLDPANNAIKYKSKGGGFCAWPDNCQTVKYATAAAAAAATCQYYGESYRGYTASSNPNVFTAQCSSGTWDFTANPSGGLDYQSIPIPKVADKIYDNAKTDSNSRSVVNDAVRDYVNSGAADTALDNAKADADATHNCGTGAHWSGSACVADTPSTPSTPTTPDTPFDPSSIIDAINSVFNAITDLFDAVMSIPDVINTAIDRVLDAIASITDVINNALDDLLVDIKDFFQPVVDSVTNFFDWVKTTYDEFVKPDNTPTDVDVNVPQTQTIDTDINFGGSCPANVTGSFVIGGRTTTFNVMDWSQFCLIMSTYLKSLVIALASYQAVKILAGRNESN